MDPGGVTHPLRSMRAAENNGASVQRDVVGVARLNDYGCRSRILVYPKAIVS